MPESLPPAADGPASAVPPLVARVIAFGAILVAGVCGGLIGFAIVDVQCAGSCAPTAGLRGARRRAGAAFGVAVVAVLVLRAMGEWRTIEQAAPRSAPTRVEPRTPGARA